jgi:hypothetical protein
MRCMGNHASLEADRPIIQRDFPRAIRHRPRHASPRAAILRSLIAANVRCAASLAAGSTCATSPVAFLQ